MTTCVPQFGRGLRTVQEAQQLGQQAVKDAIESGETVWYVRGRQDRGGRGWVVAADADDARATYLGLSHAAGRRLYGEFCDSAGHGTLPPRRQTTLPRGFTLAE